MSILKVRRDSVIKTATAFILTTNWCVINEHNAYSYKCSNFTCCCYSEVACFSHHKFYDTKIKKKLIYLNIWNVSCITCKCFYAPEGWHIVWPKVWHIVIAPSIRPGKLISASWLFLNFLEKAMTWNFILLHNIIGFIKYFIPVGF